MAIQAIEQYDEAIKLTPNDAIGYRHRGLSYYYLGQHQHLPYSHPKLQLALQ